MPYQKFRLAAVAVVLATALTAGPAAGLGAAAASAGAAAALRSGSAGLAGSVPPARRVLLINGDSVWSPGGAPGSGPSVFTPAGKGLAGSVVGLRMSGKSYAIPVAALPYLGRGLDLSLFDVALLARIEAGGRLPIRVAYRGRRPSLPGVTITTAASGVASGYLTASSAARFGAALTRLYLADHARGSYGHDGMLGGGMMVSLAGVTAARRAGARPQPGYALHTVTFNGTGLAGKADTGDVVYVFNVDDTRLTDGYLDYMSMFYRGTARFSLPSGHYWAFGDFVDVTRKGKPVSEHLVVLPQFTVSRDRQVRVAERSASSRVLVSTPRPSLVAATGFDLRRTPKAGYLMGGFWYNDPSFPLWVSPTRTRPSVGKLEDYTDQWSSSSPGTAGPYDYDLAFGATGVIPRQSRVVRQADLATVRARNYSDVRSLGEMWAVGLFRPQYRDVFLAPDYRMRMPAVRTEYVTGNPAVTWWNGMAPYVRDVGLPFDVPSGWQSGGATVYRAGQHVTENWNSFPLHPGTARKGTRVYVDYPGFSVPSASRSGDILLLSVVPFSDTSGHTGEAFLAQDGSRVTGSYEIDENGKKIAAGRTAGGRSLPRWADSSFWSARLGSKPSLVRFTLNAARARARYPLSTRTHTVWTWRSRHTTGRSLPRGWKCMPVSSLTGSRMVSPLGSYPVVRHCAVEPMMTLRYQVARLGLNETAPPGRQVLEVTAGHLPLARAAKVAGATVRVSFNGGKTWRRPAVTRLGGGHYRAVYQAPAGSYVTLRVSASDRARGRISETITRAYRISSAGSHAACPPARAGHLRCLTVYRTRPRAGQAGPAAASAAPTPSGWGARAVRDAYKLPVSQGSGQTVAIVEAFDTPGLAASLSAYRAQYSLPSCTISSGCLRKVNQEGKASPLPASAVPHGWDVETSLDADMVSAACPRCKILVVEAKDNSDVALAAAENTAARLGAEVISDSFGGREDGYSMTFSKAYDHPGHTIVVASGDLGFAAASFPANLATVTAVGGTQLVRAANSRGWRETVWNHFGASGSGCSAYVTKPPWQGDKTCPMRTIADVSAVARDLAVYDKARRGWLKVDGTSAAAPLIAGVYALAGNATAIKPGYPYGHRRYLFDITTGNNDPQGRRPGVICGFTYLCMARTGYDAPTGLGTPHGTRSF